MDTQSISRLDSSFSAVTLFLRTNAAFFARQDASGYSGVPFLRIYYISVTRLDSSFSVVALYLRINAAFVARRNTSGCSGVSSLRIDATSVTRLNSSFSAVILFLRINTVLISRRDSSCCSGESFLRIDATSVTRLDTRYKAGFKNSPVARQYSNGELYILKIILNDEGKGEVLYIDKENMWTKRSNMMILKICFKFEVSNSPSRPKKAVNQKR